MTFSLYPPKKQKRLGRCSVIIQQRLRKGVGRPGGRLINDLQLEDTFSEMLGPVPFALVITEFLVTVISSLEEIVQTMHTSTSRNGMGILSPCQDYRSGTPLGNGL
jgi:hypothetical protein